MAIRAHSVRRHCGNDQQALLLQDQAHAISYIANISEAVARLLKLYGIGFVHRPAGTLRSRLMRVKDQIDSSEQSLIIYRAQCKDCSSNNIGETSRMVGTRLKEHPVSCKKLQRAGISYGLTLRGYRPRVCSWKNKILSQANTWTARLFI